MTFKPGKSGNPKGRGKGSQNRRTQLAKLLEPHAEKIIAKMIELALSGDANALRLCVERLIPKAQHEATGIELPEKLNPENISKLKEDILRAAFDGRVTLEEAEKLKKLRPDQPSNSTTLNITTIDPVEAARIYQEIMRA